MQNIPCLVLLQTQHFTNKISELQKIELFFQNNFYFGMDRWYEKLWKLKNYNDSHDMLVFLPLQRTVDTAKYCQFCESKFCCEISSHSSAYSDYRYTNVPVSWNNYTVKKSSFAHGWEGRQLFINFCQIFMKVSWKFYLHVKSFLKSRNFFRSPGISLEVNFFVTLRWTDTKKKIVLLLTTLSSAKFASCPRLFLNKTKLLIF